MRNKAEKLEFVKGTLKICQNLAQENEERQKTWAEQGESNNAFTCRMLADAYSFIAHLLENDLKDE